MPITHTTIFVIFKMSMKWCLLDGIPFNETPMGWLVIVKSRSNIFSITSVLFRACSAWKKMHNIAGTTVQIIRLNTIFSLCTERCKRFSSNKMFAYFAPSTSSGSAAASLLFKECYLHSHKNIFQTFCSSKPIIGTFSKTFPCSLWYKCISISESTFLSFGKPWMISNIKNNSTFISHSLSFV